MLLSMRTPKSGSNNGCVKGEIILRHGKTHQGRPDNCVISVRVGTTVRHPQHMWIVPTELVSVCETDVANTRYEHCCELLQRLYEYTEGHGSWVGRRLRVYPPPLDIHPPLARDNTGCTWVLTTSTTVTNDHETLDVETMFKRYVFEEYSQQVQDDLRYREKCVNGVYVPSPELHHDHSDDDIDD